MSPAKKFNPISCTPASVTAPTKASTSASEGTAVLNGHQNSTASNPASFAAAGRANNGTSVNNMDRLTA